MSLFTDTPITDPNGEVRALQAELRRQKEQNALLYRQANEANTRTARVEERCKRLTRALRAALQIQARAFRAGFNECLELVEAGVVPEKMPAPMEDES